MGNPATQAIALVLLLVASVAHAASSTSGSWPFTDNLIAEYDESVVQGLHLTTTAMLAEPVEKLLTLDLMLYTKAIEFNTTNATRADRDDLRKLLFSQVRSATSKTTLTTWLGLAFQDDGSNMWLYPGNASYYYNSLESYRGVRVVKEMLEEGWGGQQTTECKGNNVAPTFSPTPRPTSTPTSKPTERTSYKCLYGLHLTEMGDAVYPPVATYTNYEPRTRPWYIEAQTYGADWSSNVLTWGTDALISGAVPMKNHKGEFLGVLQTAASISTIETELYKLVPDGTVVYVFQKETGKIMFTSELGQSGVMVGSTYYANYANTSANDIIRESAQELQRQSAWYSGGNFDDDAATGKYSSAYKMPNVNPFLFDGYWVEVEEINKIGGLHLRTPWMFVVVQTACTESFFFKRVAKPGKKKVTKANSLGDCHSCPEGAKCSGGLSLPYPKKGFWMDASDPAFLADDAMCCTRSYENGGECIVGSNCKGVEEEVAETCFASPRHLERCNSTSLRKMICGPGSGGKLCDVCDGPTYYLNEGSCEKCSGNVELLYLFLGLMAVVAAIAAWVWCRFGAYISANWPLIIAAVFDTGRMKVVFANAQIVGSVSWSTGVSWPKPFSYASKVFSLFELNVFDVLPLECVGPAYNFYDYVLTQTLFPILLNAALFLLMGAEMRHHKNRAGPPKNTMCSKYLGDENFVWGIILLVFYIWLPIGNLALMRIFKCTEFPDGSEYLDADLAIRCKDEHGNFTTGHIAMLTYASLMLLIYLPGIPALFYVLLSKNHDEIISYDKEQDTQEMPAALAPLKFLFFHYKPENYNAEWKECVRRMALIGGVAVLPSNQKSDNALVGMILALFFVVWQRERSPWNNPSTNALEFVFMWIIVFIFMGAYVIIVGQDDSILNPTVVSSLLLVMTVAVIIGAIKQQALEFQKNRDLLKLKGQIADFRQQVVGIAFAKRTMRAFERQRFLNGDWSMSEDSWQELIKMTSTDDDHFKDDEERQVFIELQHRYDESGKQVDWYWQEDASRQENWDPESLFIDPALLASDAKVWVKYSGAIGAQLEKRYLQVQNDPSADPIIAVDLEGRVLGADGPVGNNGLRYRVDCARLVQINARTGYERPCFRKEKDVEKGRLFKGGQKVAPDSIEKNKNVDLVDINSFTSKDGPGTAVTFNADTLDRREITDDDMPPFPRDLIEAGEPVLLIQKGQLIQIQKKRDDGWMFGFVVWEDPNNSDDKKDDRPTRAFAKMMPNADPDPASDAADAPAVNVAWEDTGKEEDLGGEHSGWFPSIFVRPPQMQELKDMQEAMGGAEEAVNVLAVPDDWSAESKTGLTTSAKIVKLDKNSEQFKVLEKNFRARMGDRENQIKTIHAISRVENLSLWQSYAAKKNSMMMRAKNEGVPDATALDYEVAGMYHGCSLDVIPKIVQQGFNRMFCGKNAVRYGKGVYFALTAAYSHNYAQPDSSGVKKLFVCRVLKGETSQGHNEQLVPEVRIAATQTLYDSTTDQLACPEPAGRNAGKYGSGVRQMYVVYHDAQAYPEYLLEYKS